MFPFLRIGIPNKPPPPYPVQLPKTPPFPSDDRIKEIVNHRVNELFDQFNSSQSSCETPIRNDATFVKSPNLSMPSPDLPTIQKDTNVFERIILDSCDEIMHEICASNKLSSSVFRQPLEFYNPPNRLHCLQQHTIKRIFKLIESKSFGGMRSFLPSQVAQLTFNNRRKRDAVDDILIQELYEDEPRWTNFDLEEQEIRDSVTDLNTLLLNDDSSFMNATE